MEYNKKAKAILSSFLLLFATMTACTDLEPLTSRVDSLDSRLTSLENTCKNLNSDVSSLQEILKAMQNCDYITDVTQNVEGGTLVGYKIHFANGLPITIFNGTDGTDGKNGIAPKISVREDKDGLQYWTINGEWVLDPAGHKVPVVGSSTVPQFRVNEKYWEISYDNGKSWTQCGKASGSEGNGENSLFKDIKVEQENVTFVLSDGTSFIVPRSKPIDVTFQSADLVTMQKNSKRDIHYSVQASVEKPSIEVISSGGIKSKLTRTDAKSGIITVETGSVIDEYCKVVVLATDGRYVIIKTLRFEEEEIMVEEDTRKTVSGNGGTVALEFFSNTECEVEIPESARSWIKVAPESKALVKQSLNIVVSPNDGVQRSASVCVHPKGNTSSFKLIYEIVQAPTPEAQKAIEREALIEIYKSTGGENWMDNTNWCSEKPVSEWYGIRTDEDGLVVEIYLWGNNLNGELPDAIGSFPQLTSIEISYNKELSGQIPSTIGNLTNLSYISITQNKITGEIPESIGNLKNLNSINLYMNQLSGSIPSCLSKLKKLNEINLMDNRLSGEIPDFFDQLPELNILYLCSNELTESIPASIFHLAKLAYLNLSFNQLTGSIPEEIGNLTKLTYLFLQNNHLSGYIPDKIGNLDKLQYLDLSNNHLDGSIPDKCFGKMDQLEELYLSDNNLSGTLPDEIFTLPKLVSLDIANNMLDEDDLNRISEHPNYQESLFKYLPQFSYVDAGKERQVLIDLFNSTDGGHWKDNTNWCSDKPISEWFGIYTNEKGGVRSISLQDNGLSGKIPESIGELGCISFLNLGNNQLTGSIPESIENLTSLSCIRLNDNRLTGAIPESIGNLNLTDLFLTNNQLTGSIPTSFANISDLYNFRVNNNYLDLSDLDAFKDHKYYTNWYLYPQALAPEVKEKERQALIDFYNAMGGDNWTNNTNWCSDKPVSEWYGIGTNDLGNVRQIFLDDNNLCGKLPDAISTLTELYYLWLSNNHISGSIPECLGSMVKLENLYLNNNDIRGPIPDGVISLPKLEILYIDSNYIETESIERFISKHPGNDMNMLFPQYDYSDLEAERQALIDLYQATDGENWRRKANWCSEKPVSEWEGISVNGKGSVFVIWLPNNDMKGNIPESLGALKNLVNLGLTDNQLTGSLPEFVAHNEKLTEIDFSDNQLTGSIPASYSDRADSMGILLTNNHLSGVIPANFLKDTHRNVLGTIMEGNDFSLEENFVLGPDFTLSDEGHSIDSRTAYSSNKLTCVFEMVGYCSDIVYTFMDFVPLYESFHELGLEIVFCMWGDPIKDRQLINELNLPWFSYISSVDPFSNGFIGSGWSAVNLWSYVIVDSQQRVLYFDRLHKDEHLNELKQVLSDRLGDIKPVETYTSTDYSHDGDVTVLQKATKGKGIDIVFMGDAYSDKQIADGTYEAQMRKGMEAFFSEEPYSSNRDLFNVSMVTAVSANDHYGEDTHTALEGYFGDGTKVGGNDSKVFSYAEKALNDEQMDEATIIVVMNDKRHAGTCYMYGGGDGDFGNGVSIAYVPKQLNDKEFTQTVLHEAGGHAFGKLADEYFYDGTISSSEISSKYRSSEPLGWYRNVDFTNDLHNIKWSKFISDNRYAWEKLGAYEGACTYAHGAYRPTEISIMYHNTGGFNAPSREAIYYRINKLAYGKSWTYDYQTFVTWDLAHKPQSAPSTKASYVTYTDTKDFKPLAPPVIRKGNWKTYVK